MATTSSSRTSSSSRNSNTSSTNRNSTTRSNTSNTSNRSNRTGTILRSSSGATYNTATGERGGTQRYSAQQVAQINSARANNVASGRKATSGAGSLSTITSNNLQNTALIDIPTPPPVKNEMSTIIGANAAVTDPTTGVSSDGKGGLVYTDPTTATNAAPSSMETNLQSYLNQYKSAFDSQMTGEERYNKLYKDSGLKDINKQISDNTAMINNITAKAQAESLGLEGQGRGITESIIGGQQAQISREAAIQALPYQALLANAQGNKELAQSLLETRYKIQSEDAQNKFNYDMKVLDSLKGFLDKKEERAFQVVQQEKQDAFQLKRDTIQNERENYRQQMGFNNSIALKKMDIEEKAKESVGGNSALLGLLNQYKTQLKDSNAFTARFNPTKVANLSSLKGQITAEYKKAEKLGTLDAGVQKLIDTIIPPAGGFGLVSLSPSAQVSAIDNFITNQGGSVLSPEDEDEIDNIATGSKGFNPVNYFK